MQIKQAVNILAAVARQCNNAGVLLEPDFDSDLDTLIFRLTFGRYKRDVMISLYEIESYRMPPEEYVASRIDVVIWELKNAR